VGKVDEWESQGMDGFCGYVEGDVILTGTPAGVGPAAAGQRVEVEIEGIGTLSNPFIRRD